MSEIPEFEKNIARQVGAIEDSAKLYGIEFHNDGSVKNEEAIDKLEKENDAMRMTLIAEADNLIQKIDEYCAKEYRMSKEMAAAKMKLMYIEGELGNNVPLYLEGSLDSYHWEDLSDQERTKREKDLAILKKFIDVIEEMLNAKGYRIIPPPVVGDDALWRGATIRSKVLDGVSTGEDDRLVVMDGKLSFEKGLLKIPLDLKNPAKSLIKIEKALQMNQKAESI